MSIQLFNWDSTISNVCLQVSVIKREWLLQIATNAKKDLHLQTRRELTCLYHVILLYVRFRNTFGHHNYSKHHMGYIRVSSDIQASSKKKPHRNYVIYAILITDGTQEYYKMLSDAMNELHTLAMNQTLDIDIGGDIHELNSSSAMADSSVSCSSGMVSVRYYCSEW